MAKRSLRVEYGTYLAEAGGKYPNIIVLDADLKESTQSIQFQDLYPDRYFDIGVAEQNMVGIAAGLSLCGKIPIAHSFACFMSMRACEQVRTTVAYTNRNVKLVASHGGISAGSAGTTHHATEDIAIMRSIANMTVIIPGDVAEMKQAVDAALLHEGPVYIRLGANDAEDVYGDGDRFSIGKATELRNGDDAAIITTGYMMHEGVTAAEILNTEYGLKVRVLQMASVKPLDREAVIRAASETGNIVTVEEHNILGGLGGAVCEVAAETGVAQVKRIGVQDRFVGIGTAEYLMEEEGISVERIIAAVRDLTENKDA
ncbi:transketolase family protein [Gemmatimonadota bacterium]